MSLVLKLAHYWPREHVYPTFRYTAKSASQHDGGKRSNQTWQPVRSFEIGESWGGRTQLQTGISINLAFWYIKLFLLLRVFSSSISVETSKFSRYKFIFSINQRQKEPIRFCHRAIFFELLPFSLLLIYQLFSLLSFAWFASSSKTVSLLLFCGASTFPPFVSICVGWAGRTMPLTAEADRLPLVPPPQPSFICRNTPAGGSSRVKAIFTEDPFKTHAAIFLQTRVG